MNQVRWIAQCRKAGSVDEWHDREDVIYSGWFYSNGNDDTEHLVKAISQAAKRENWLEWQLIQENRSATRKVIEWNTTR